MHQDNQNDKRKSSFNFFTLHQKKPGGSYSACYCYLGQAKWLGTGTADVKEATRVAKYAEADILKELAFKAALEAEEDAGSSENPAPAANSVLASPPPLDLTKPAPEDSFRQRIEAEVQLLEDLDTIRPRKLSPEVLRQHLFHVLGAYVDLDIASIDGSMGHRLADFYNDPSHFNYCGRYYARQMRRFLRPMAADGLSMAFIDCLNKCGAQSPGGSVSKHQETPPILWQFAGGLSLRYAGGKLDRNAVYELGHFVELWLLAKSMAKRLPGV
jgi:hypothetical protein